MTTTEPKMSEDPTGPEPLLPGETRTSPLVDDAEHWIRVYSEFIRFKSELLSEVDAASQKLAEDLRTTASVTDVAQLRTQYERLLERLEFWQSRLVELKAAGT